VVFSATWGVHGIYDITSLSNGRPDLSRAAILENKRRVRGIKNAGGALVSATILISDEPEQEFRATFGSPILSRLPQPVERRDILRTDFLGAVSASNTLKGNAPAGSNVCVAHPGPLHLLLQALANCLRTSVSNRSATQIARADTRLRLLLAFVISSFSAKRESGSRDCVRQEK
jgi:hypothetical protein